MSCPSSSLLYDGWFASAYERLVARRFQRISWFRATSRGNLRLVQGDLLPVGFQESVGFEQLVEAICDWYRAICCALSSNQSLGEGFSHHHLITLNKSTKLSDSTSVFTVPSLQRHQPCSCRAACFWLHHGELQSCCPSLDLFTQQF